MIKGGVARTYKYDALGHRVERTEGSETTRYVLNLNSPISLILQTTDENGTLRSNYVYGLGLLESIDKNDSVLYYHFDAGHNTVAVTDNNASVKATYTYLPFGALIAKTGTIEQPFTFLGEFGVEKETDSCYYIRARYYDASTGRFLSKDPLFGDEFDPQSLNRYVYAMNNPVTSYDATGLTTSDDDGGSFLGQFSKENIMNLTLDAIDNGRSGEAMLGIISMMGYEAAEGALMLVGGGEIRVIKTMAELRAFVPVISSAKGILAKEVEGVYKIITNKGSYIGQSTNLWQRITSHFSRNGKLANQTLKDQIYFEMKGSTKLEREVYEQYLINKAGIGKLLNVRNPMGGRMDKYDNMFRDVINKYSLPW